MIHLDTSFLINALRPGSRQERLLLAWLSDEEALGIGAFAWAEFLCGPISREIEEDALELLGEPAPFGRSTAETAAALFNKGGRRRGSLGDCLVAAAAIEAGAQLATANPRDFERFTKDGLALAC